MNFENVKPLLLGAVGGAIVLAVVGFKFGGWVTSGNAAQMSEEAAENAVLNRMTKICVEQYKQDPNKGTKLTALMEKSTWDRRDFVAEQGWSLILGELKADPDVSKSCANEISEMQS